MRVPLLRRARRRRGDRRRPPRTHRWLWILDGHMCRQTDCPALLGVAAAALQGRGWTGRNDLSVIEYFIQSTGANKTILGLMEPTCGPQTACTGAFEPS